MATDINWENLERKLIDNAVEAVNGQLHVLKDEIDRNTPVDTGDLIGNTKINPAVLEWNRISGSVSNETEYGIFVEYGVQGKTYNYHKQKRIFYVGVGARMFTRAYDRLKATIAKNLKKALNL